MWWHPGKVTLVLDEGAMLEKVKQLQNSLLRAILVISDSHPTVLHRNAFASHSLFPPPISSSQPRAGTGASRLSTLYTSQFVTSRDKPHPGSVCFCVVCSITPAHGCKSDSCSACSTLTAATQQRSLANRQRHRILHQRLAKAFTQS